MTSTRRLARISTVVNQRQKYFTIVLENIHDPHNVSAILRSADCVGIDRVQLIYNTTNFPKIGKVSSASAKKWVDVEKYETVNDCFKKLKSEKYKIYSTDISEGKKNLSLYDLNLSERVAIVFGNEHSGVSEEVKALADKNFIIPMFGMIQSLNVSVAVAVCLYEALRQRELNGLYKKSAYTKKELNKKIQDYIKK